MSGTLRPTQAPPATRPLLVDGQRLDQPTFHARYEAMPPGFRAELIEGVVVVPSPLSRNHGLTHIMVSAWAGQYWARTPGTSALDNATLILSPETEPQPDVEILLAPECGGRTRMEGEYLAGVPELVVEVASSSASHDLHTKRAMYEGAGVPEYVVVVLREPRVIWLRLVDGHYVEVAPDAEGLLRSTIFPGLWLDPHALLRGDMAAVLEALGRGLECPEHAAFVRDLEARRSQ